MPRADCAAYHDGVSPRKTDAPAAYHHGNVPAAVAEAALDLIAEKGIDAFTLREAARRIGITHGAVYRHFADKRALLAAIAEDGFNRLAEGIEKKVARAGDDALERLKALAVAYLQFAMSNRACYFVMFGPRLNPDGKFPGLEQAVMRALHDLKGEVERGLQAGHIHGPDARTVAMTIWSMAHGYTMLLLNGRIYTKGPKETERFFLSLLEPLLKGLAAEP